MNELIPLKFEMQRFFLALAAMMLVAGCRSKPPPATPPAALQKAQSTARQAAKLLEAENWPAATRQWQKAAEQYALLNNPVGEAMALHNLAQAEREQGHFMEAQTHLDRAAALNRENHQTNTWWRNQIALLQLQAITQNDTALDEQLSQLLTSAASLPWPELRGLFYNELGQRQTSRQQFGPALASFSVAEQAFVEAKSPSGQAAVEANRAQLYLDQTNYTAALKEWKQALAAYEELALPEGISRCLLGLGTTLLAGGQELSRAEEYLRQAVRNFRSLRDSRSELIAQRRLLACLEAEGKNPQAEWPRLAQILDLEANRLADQNRKSEASRYWEESAALWDKLNMVTARDQALERSREIIKIDPPKNGTGNETEIPSLPSGGGEGEAR